MRSLLYGFVLLLTLHLIRGEFVSLGRNTYYIERELRLNWAAAWNYCASNNTHLISIETDLESRLLAQYMDQQIFLFWTSGNDLAEPSAIAGNRKFVWSGTGRPFAFTNWVDNEPSNVNDHCVVLEDLRGIGSRWNDYDCTKQFRFICEF